MCSLIRNTCICFTQSRNLCNPGIVLNIFRILIMCCNLQIVQMILRYYHPFSLAVHIYPSVNSYMYVHVTVDRMRVVAHAHVYTVLSQQCNPEIAQCYNTHVIDSYMQLLTDRYPHSQWRCTCMYMYDACTMYSHMYHAQSACTTCTLNTYAMLGLLWRGTASIWS